MHQNKLFLVIEIVDNSLESFHAFNVMLIIRLADSYISTQTAFVQMKRYAHNFFILFLFNIFAKNSPKKNNSDPNHKSAWLWARPHQWCQSWF